MSKTYTIGELAEAAKVTTRTIRYYVTEGLLSPPDKDGRVATYTAEYIARLRLIKILKEEFLPLQEISALLAGLDHQAVLDLLAEKQNTELVAPAPKTAKQYLQTLLAPEADKSSQQSMLRHRLRAKRAETDSQLEAVARPEPSAPAAPTGEQAKTTSSEAVTPPIPQSVDADSTITRWQRIPITAEVELHVKEGIEKTSLWQKVEQLIKIARQLLSAMIS